MIRRLLRDESGAALGMAVVLVVLIGIMAAGLLTVLRSDLEGTVQGNRGQRALHLADAGSRAAAAHLRADANPDRYDANGTDNSDWARVPPSGAPGKALVLGQDAATVTVEYLMPALTPAQQSDEHHAPEPVPAGLTDYPDEDFFLVASEGASGATRRKVEVIFRVKGSGESREVVLWSWREGYG